MYISTSILLLLFLLIFGLEGLLLVLILSLILLFLLIVGVVLYQIAPIVPYVVTVLIVLYLSSITEIIWALYRVFATSLMKSKNKNGLLLLRSIRLFNKTLGFIHFLLLLPFKYYFKSLLIFLVSCSAILILSKTLYLDEMNSLKILLIVYGLYIIYLTLVKFQLIKNDLKNSLKSNRVLLKDNFEVSKK